MPAARATFLERVDDALNPIVVKELRQAVQSRFVVAVLIIFLLLQLAWIGIQLLVVGFQGRLDSIEFQGGREVFTALQVILLATCMLFLPLYTATRLAAERNEANTDLLFITTISPRKIVSGKLISAMVLALLIFSACTPFMALTYYLRGIDWPSIFFVLAIDFVVVTASVQLMVFFAIIPCNRVFKSLLGLAGFIALAAIFFFTLFSTIAVIQQPIIAEFFRAEFWFGMAVALAAIVGLTGLLFTWSVALLQSPSSNRAMSVRAYTAVFCAAMFVASAAYCIAINYYPPMAVWLMFTIGLAGLNVAIGINERRDWSPRVARKIPRNLIARLIAFVLFSGAGGGVLFGLLLFGAASLAYLFVREGGLDYFWPATIRSLNELDEFYEVSATLFAYLYAYAMTAVLLRDFLLRGVNAAYTWVVMLLLVAAGSLLPMVISFLLMMDRWRYDDHYYFLLLNPFSALIELTDLRRRHGTGIGQVYIFFAVGWAAVVTALNVPWFFGQFFRFRRSEEKPRPAPPPVPTLEPASPATARGAHV
jgi:hypothetical protein